MRCFLPPRDLKESGHVSAILSGESEQKNEICEKFANGIYHKFDQLEKNIYEKIYNIFNMFFEGNLGDLRREMKESITENMDLRADIKGLRSDLQAELQDLRERSINAII